MANYDSDFEVRLATLQALGGDVTIKYDSVYSIDLAILAAIQGGGGEGMTYDQIKAALAASGVTEILINGDGDSITLDYDLLSQIGQGGAGDYICVDSVEALSGITSPKDGMIAYVAGKGMWKYDAATGVTKWLMFDVDYDTLTADEINTMCNDYVSYRNELTIRTHKASGYDNNHIWVMTPQECYNNNWLSFSSGISHTADGRQEVYKMVLSKSGQNWTFNVGGSKLIVMFSDDNNSCFNYTKNKLTSNGVNSIKFVSGSTSAITLDYNLISQIGQGGGGDYLCVDSIDELSGITNPKDGMIAYVGERSVVEEKKVVVFDAYNDGSYVRFDYGDSNDCHFHTWDNGWSFSLEGTGGFQGGGDYKSYENRDQFPIDFTFNNGATGTLVAIEHGDEWDSHQEYKVTVWLDKYNNAYPTITFETGEYTTVVESGATTENVNVPIKAKGYFRYYADEAKWFAYEVWLDNLDNSELDDILQDYFDYRKPLSGWFKKDDYGWAYRKGFAGSTYNTSEPKIHFTTPITEMDAGWKSYSKNYIKIDGHWIIYNDIDDNTFVNQNEVRESIAQKIFTTSQPNGGNELGGLYSVGVNETVSGVTISTTIPTDATATTSQHIATIYNSNTGRGNWESLSEDGWLFTNKGGISASTSAEWFVIDYSTTWDGDLNKNVTYIAAAKIEDNGDNTFTVTYFLGSDTWNGDEWSEQRGHTNYYSFNAYNDRGYTWTVTEHQTLAVTPHLYTQVRFDHGDDTNARYIHKLV